MRISLLPTALFLSLALNLFLVGVIAGTWREMRGPPARFAAGSRSIPSQADMPQIAARVSASFSPIPAVKTRASSPPSAAASEPISRPAR